MSAGSILVLVSTTIILFLGTAHLIYTFRGSKLRPRNDAATAAMRDSALGITHDTTVMDAWVGFNASHSLGALLFATVYAYLATSHPAVLFGSLYLQSIGFAFLLSLTLLAHRYWFRTPLVGITLALLCFSSGVLVSNL